MLQALLELKPRDVPINVALRNSAGVVLPLAIGIATGHVGAGLGVASGALNTMFLDQPGPYLLRMQRMLLTSLAAGLSGFTGAIVGAHPVLMVIAALVWGIGGGMLVALGQNAGRAGLTCMILLLVMGAAPQDASGALGAAAALFAGGLLQTLFSLAAWPLHRYRPEREALAALCRDLAAITHRPIAPDRQHRPPPVTQALLGVEQLLHGAHRARGTAMDTFRVLARIIERSRLELLALGDMLDALPEAGADDHAVRARHTLLRLREYCARTFDSVAAALQRGASPLNASGALEGFDAALGELEQLGAGDHAGLQRTLAIAFARAQALGGQLRALVRNAEFAGSRGELRADEDEARLPAALRPGSPMATLRANFHLQSVAFRHALRCGVCLAIAVAGERALGVEHGFWVPMTTAIVLKPDFAGTFSFGLLRVAGTIAGLLLTSVLVHYAFGGVWAQVALLAVMCLGFRLLTTVNYGLGVMMLTGLIVIMLSLFGYAPGDTMLLRGVATAIGSAFALLAYALWPTWEQLRPALGAMIDAYRAYFSMLFIDDAGARHDARVAARSARTNAQASLDRLRGEPKHDDALVALAEAVFANANRFIRAVMSLEAVLQDSAERPARVEVRAFALKVEASLGEIGASLREGRVAHVESLRRSERHLARMLAESNGSDQAAVAIAISDACDRITDSINTLAHLSEGAS
ncbi:MAG: FUSC family protein [Rudaea sp.]